MSPSDFPALYETTGLVGVVFYLLAYGLLQAGLIGGNSYSYTLLNLFAASCVLVSLALHFNLSSLLIQISWIVISIFGMTRVFILTKRVRFSPEEAFLRETKLAGLSALDARQFLSQGSWVEMLPGAVLLQEGEPVERLYFLAEGEVDISLGGRHLTRVGRGGLLGEMGALTGSNASATVTAYTGLRVFMIEHAALAQLCARNMNIKTTLFSSITEDLAEKLRRSNQITEKAV